MGANSKDFLKLREDESVAESKLALNKGTLNAQIQNIVGSVERGDVNPLEAFIFLNWMGKLAEGAKKKLLDQAIDEAEKYPEKEAEIYDAIVTIKNGAGRYTYPESIKKLQELSKLACKAQKEDKTIVDDNGEIVEPAVYKEGKTTLSITFK